MVSNGPRMVRLRPDGGSVAPNPACSGPFITYRSCATVKISRRCSRAMLRFINTVQPGGIEIMQNTNVGVETFSEDRQPRLPYHAPELISLGQIQSIVQFG